GLRLLATPVPARLALCRSAAAKDEPWLFSQLLRHDAATRYRKPHPSSLQTWTRRSRAYMRHLESARRARRRFHPPENPMWRWHQERSFSFFKAVLAVSCFNHRDRTL